MIIFIYKYRYLKIFLEQQTYLVVNNVWSQNHTNRFICYYCLFINMSLVGIPPPTPKGAGHWLASLTQQHIQHIQGGPTSPFPHWMRSQAVWVGWFSRWMQGVNGWQNKHKIQLSYWDPPRVSTSQEQDLLPNGCFFFEGGGGTPKRTLIGGGS